MTKIGIYINLVADLDVDPDADETEIVNAAIDHLTSMDPHACVEMLIRSNLETVVIE